MLVICHFYLAVCIMISCLNTGLNMSTLMAVTHVLVVADMHNQSEKMLFSFKNDCYFKRFGMHYNFVMCLVTVYWPCY